MLSLITLNTIEKIFEGKPVSSMARMIYVNCLIKHFKGKTATTKNAFSFELFDTDLDMDKYKKFFVELHRAEIVCIEGNTIRFTNVWGQYIDRSKLNKTDHISSEVKWRFLASDFKDQLVQVKTEMFELVCMKNRITKEQALSYIDQFIKKHDAIKKYYHDESDCRGHCVNWIEAEVRKSKGVTTKGKAKGLGV